MVTTIFGATLVLGVVNSPPAGALESGVVGFGAAAPLGAPGSLHRPLITIAAQPGGAGYWLVAGDGGVFSYGGAPFYGSTGGMVLNAPVVDMTPRPNGAGYWMVASDGGVFSFGDAPFFGSTGGIALNQPIASMVSTASGNGYWMVARDGGVFAFGAAQFFGSAPNWPHRVVDMVARPQGDGYWIIDERGGVQAFGGAPKLGDLPGLGVATTTIVGGAVTPSGNGYWLAGTDGGIFTFGDAPFFGAGPPSSGRKVVGIAVKPGAGGYWLAETSGFLAAGPGEVGEHVAAVQNHLGQLGFWIDAADGRYGYATSQAVMAFQKWAGLPRTGVADQRTVDALFASPRPRARTTTGNAFEIDKSRQVMYLVQNGVTTFVFNVSTGSEIPYRERTKFGFIASGDAVTYDGTFRMYRQIDGGWYESELGMLWRPKFFNGGIAIHGSLDVPGYPASHGCVRVAVAAMNWIWDAGVAPMGTTVIVY